MRLLITYILLFIVNIQFILSQSDRDTILILQDGISHTSYDTRHQEAKENELGMEINGLVMDETISKLGRDFYDLFFTKWDIETDVDYLLKIVEKPEVPALK